MSVKTLRIMLTTVFLTLVVAPLVAVPYLGDDVANRSWANTSWSQSIQSAWDLQLAWIQGQGRFFPGSALYSLPLWHVFDTRIAYHMYLLALNLLLIALVGLLIYRFTRSGFVTGTAMLFFGGCLQARWALDGLPAFAGLVQYTLVLCIVAGVGAALVLRGGSRWWGLLAMIAWTLAITTYEVALLMLPAILLLLYGVFGYSDRSRARWALGPLIVPSVAVLLTVLWLQSNALSRRAEFTVDLHGPVASTFLKQFSAALPHSQYLLGEIPATAAIPGALILLTLVCFAVPAFLLWRPTLGVGVSVPRRVSVCLVLAGLWAWAAPSALVGVTQRWQTELPWGSGYIPVLFEYVGVALAVAGALSLIADRSCSRGWRLTATVFLGIACVACALTLAGNLVFVDQFVPGPHSALG